MADDFHHCAFVLELVELVLFNDFFLDLLNCDRRVLPPTTVDDTVATLRQLPVELELFEGDLVVLDVHSILIHHVHKSLVLTHDKGTNLALDELSVGTCLLELTENLAMVLAQHFDELLLFISEVVFIEIFVSLFDGWL